MLKTYSVPSVLLFLILLFLLFLLLPYEKPYKRRKWQNASNGSISARSNDLHCDCDGGDPVVGGEPVSSICSARATSRGPNQRVVSYSLYGSKGERASSEYEGLLPRLCENVKAQYPGWVMRIYTNYKPDIIEQKEWMCGIQCMHSHVDFCLVDRLPVLGDVAKIQEEGMTWRFLPGMDPLVDVFLSRDTDSLVIDREQVALQEWMDSDSMIHAMRDHPHHWRHILGGLWGAKTFMNRILMANITIDVVLKTHLERKRGRDQDALQKVLWPAAKHKMMIHDSYFCTRPAFQGPKYLSFPTRRDEGDFVSIGPRTAAASKQLEKCPMECRPKNHQDWEYC